MSLTSIITVNFNQAAVTIDMLRSVVQHTDRSSTEVILVDNGSIEDHEAAYRAACPGLIYIRSAKNLGFAGGNNLGIRAATGDYLLLLNNDTEITAGMVGQLCREMEANPQIGLLSPLILYYDAPGTVQYAGFTPMNYLTGRNSAIGYQEPDQGQYDQISRETGYCHGAAMMCRRADLQQAGLMDEHYFLYYEELDWCEQFRRSGKKSWFTGHTKIYHKESVSVGRQSSIKTYFMTRNRMRFIRRNTGLLNTMLFSLFYIGIACPKQILHYLKDGRKDLIKWVIKGVQWNLTHSKNSSVLGYKI